MAMRLGVMGAVAVVVLHLAPCVWLLVSRVPCVDLTANLSSISDKFREKSTQGGCGLPAPCNGDNAL